MSDVDEVSEEPKREPIAGGGALDEEVDAAGVTGGSAADVCAWRNAVIAALMSTGHTELFT